MRYAVETNFMGTWENCWTDDNGSPVTFDTRENAEQEIKDHICDCVNAVEGGDMADSPDPSDFREVEVAGTKTA